MESKEFEALLSDVEVRLERLRALYEQYFQGVERLEPTVPAKELDRRIRALRKAQPTVRNTALRFRFQTVWQRYTTFQTYWRRVARQIEEGTYRRDLMKARARREEQRRQREERRPATRSHDLDLSVDINVDEAMAQAEHSVDRPTTPSPRPASSAPVPRASKPPRSFVSPFARTPGSQGSQVSLRPATPGGQPPTPGAAKGPGGQPPTPGRPPTPAAAKAPPPVPGAAKPAPPRGSGPTPGPGEDRIRSLYQQYVEARKRNNERTDNVRYETVARSVREMVPKLQRKHQGKSIDFEVVVRNGRVGLKPVTKK